MKLWLALVFSAASVCAIEIPAGTQLEVRITDKIAVESMHPRDVVHAVLIAPVLVAGKVALPLMAHVTGEVKEARAADGNGRAALKIDFDRIGTGKYATAMSAIVTEVENAREKVDENGVIGGIDSSQTYGGRLNEGISKLRNSDHFGALAGILQAAKQGLNIDDVNPNIDYDPGAELRLKLTAPLAWQGPEAGPESALQPFPNEGALISVVNNEPFRTMSPASAGAPARPSDITNLMLIGTADQIRQAFENAGWSQSANLSAQSKMETARALIADRGYREGPMSLLTLNGQSPVVTWQKGNNTFAARHHLRIFRTSDVFDGKPVWVASSTHDIGIEFSDRDYTFIHKIDSNIDRERAKVVNDLLGTGMIRALALVDRPGIPHGATNATGDVLQTDGRMAVLLFR